MKNHILLLLTACWLAAFVALLITFWLEQSKFARTSNDQK